MDWRHILVASAVSALAGWLGHALHLQTKTEQQVDKAIGAPAGTAQSLLDAAEQAAVNAGEKAALGALDKTAK